MLDSSGIKTVETQTDSRYVLIEYICSCCKKISSTPDYISPIKTVQAETEDFLQLEKELKRNDTTDSKKISDSPVFTSDQQTFSDTMNDDFA